MFVHLYCSFFNSLFCFKYTHLILSRVFHVLFCHAADDDKSMLTEQIEPLPKVPSPVKKSAVVQNKQIQQKKAEKQEKPVKPKAKGGRAKGRISTPERKPVRKEPVYIPREEVKKKKGSHDFVFLLIS